MNQQMWEERYAQREAVWSGKVNPWLVEVAGPLSPGTALDLACGEGGDAIWLAEQGWQVTGVDFAAAGLARAAKAAEATGVAVDWVQADLSQWQPTETFDLVTMHFLHGPRELREAALRSAWAATGGTLLVVSHDKANLTEGTAGGPPDPDVLYGPTEMLAAIGVGADDPVVRRAEVVVRDTDQGRWVDGLLVLSKPDL